MVSARVQPASSGSASRPAGRGRPCQRVITSSTAISAPRARNRRGDGKPTIRIPRLMRRPSPLAQVRVHTMEPPPTPVMRSENWGRMTAATNVTSAIPRTGRSVPLACSSRCCASPPMRENSYQGIQVCHWTRAWNGGLLIGLFGLSTMCLPLCAFPACHLISPFVAHCLAAPIAVPMPMSVTDEATAPTIAPAEPTKPPTRAGIL